jgi:hypothetical protein
MNAEAAHSRETACVDQPGTVLTRRLQQPPSRPSGIPTAARCHLALRRRVGHDRHTARRVSRISARAGHWPERVPAPGRGTA